MRILRTAIVAGLVVLGTSAAIDAQTPDTLTNVPFAFNIGTTSFPRDTYRVSRPSSQTGVLTISSLRHSAIVLSQADGPSDTDNSPRLVFHRYGDHYFLREVRLPGKLGFTLPATRVEREAAERIAGSTSPELVVVPAQQE
jgi:hypothetical protein